MKKKVKQKLEYIARGVRFDSEVWGELARLKRQFGSYNKGLRVVLLRSENGRPAAGKGKER